MCHRWLQDKDTQGAGSHVPALTAWGQGGSYTHSTALTHTRHRCQSSNTINEP